MVGANPLAKTKWLEREGEVEYFAVQHPEKASPEKNNQQNL